MSLDAVIEHYKQHVDRTLLRETMKLTPQQRLERFEGFMADIVELHLAGQRHRVRLTRKYTIPASLRPTRDSQTTVRFSN